MSYTKNTWNTGDVVTAAKLNNMENGIKANSESPLIVVLTLDSESRTYSASKTYAEIIAAMENNIPIIADIYGTLLMSNGTWSNGEKDAVLFSCPSIMTTNNGVYAYLYTAVIDEDETVIVQNYSGQELEED